MNARTAAAAVCGKNHQRAGLPCQDRAAGQVCSPLAVAVLCDGAGSCAQSERAAQRLVDWLPGYLHDRFDSLYGDPANAPVQLIADGCAALATLGLPLEDCYCTLLFYAQHTDGRWLCGHLGDGFIFRVAGGATEVLSMPENGEFVNETYFLTAPHAAEHLHLLRGTTTQALEVLLTSDGGDSLFDFDNRTPAPAVTTLCGWLADPANTPAAVSATLRQVLKEKLSHYSDDDLSLSLLWFAPDGQ